MCIAILNKTSVLPLETIKNSFENNPDGAGIAAIIDGKIKVYKELSLTNYKAFYAKYAEFRKASELPILLHFRIGTSGVKDERNIHPFMINSKIALIHNGMISYNSVDENYSDTWHFTELLKSLKNPNRLLNKNTLEYQMFSAFSKSSKIALLHVSGQYSILNESSGKWHGDTWYSNETYKTCNYRNVGGKIIYNNGKQRDNFAAEWGYNDYGFYGYGHNTKPAPKIADIPAIAESDFPLLNKEFEAMSYAERQREVIAIGKAAHSDKPHIFDVHSYTTCINSLFALERATSLRELYDLLWESYFIFTDINSSGVENENT